MDYPNALVGVATGASGLVVGDIDRKNGKDGFLSLAHAGRSLTPTVHYPTDSNGEHWVYRGDATLSPSTNLDGMEGVDRRSGGSYIIWWSDLVPATLSDFSSDVPEWLTHVSTKPVTQHTGFEGAINEWLDTLPSGQPSPKVRAFLQAIPVDNFGHEDVVRVTYNLVRLGSEREPGVRQALDMLYKLWVKPPYDTPEHKSELVKAVQGAIRKAGAPEAKAPDLLPIVDVLNSLPEFSTTGTEFMTMVTEEPTVKTVGVYAEARAQLIREMLAAGLSEQQALTVAWHSKVVGDYATDPGGLQQLWGEVEAIAAENVPDEPLATVTPIKTATTTTTTLALLNDAERAFLAEQGSWLGTTYVNWAADRLRKTNAPYNRMNRWTWLSLVLSPYVFLSPDGIRMDFNFFQMIVGGSSTGKTQSKNLLREVLKAYFPHDATPNIGGDLSKESLTKVLIQRDGRPSWLHRDDADGLLREVQGARGNWNEGLIQRWCDFFEGRVDPIYRQGDKEASGIEAHAFLVAHFVGVLKEVTAVADEKLWTSGLFPRFVFAIGEPADTEVTGVRLNLAVGAAATDGDPLVKQWAAELSACIDGFGDEDVSMGMDVSAINKFEQITKLVQQYARTGSDDARLEAVANRFGNNVLKAAGLAAACEGFTEITLRHMLIALEQAEEWWSNVLYMLEATNETPLSRKAAELEEMIRKTDSKTIPLALVHKRYRPLEESERIIKQLEVEERAVKDRTSAGVNVLRLVERKKKGRVAA